jgi:hypothetical protein
MAKLLEKIVPPPAPVEVTYRFEFTGDEVKALRTVIGASSSHTINSGLWEGSPYHSNLTKNGLMGLFNVLDKAVVSGSIME